MPNTIFLTHPACLSREPVVKLVMAINRTGGVQYTGSNQSGECFQIARGTLRYARSADLCLFFFGGGERSCHMMMLFC